MHSPQFERDLVGRVSEKTLTNFWEDFQKLTSNLLEQQVMIKHYVGIDKNNSSWLNELV